MSTSAPSLPKTRLTTVYRRLEHAYGPQHWWPGDTPFETMVGAVLTQNTAWANVEKAIANLKVVGKLDPQAIVKASPARLGQWIKPSGYYNVKAKRLQAFCRWYLAQGGYGSLQTLDTQRLRRGLLSVNGIGPETADDMVLYAFNRPVFVIDAYTRRLFGRLGLIGGDEGYESLRHAIEAALGPNVAMFNEYHALIVIHAKDVCRVRPRCGECCFSGDCPAAT
jgi:endonuclease-3 related protein